jgi:hypothetical protein
MTITLYELRPSPHARKVRLLAAELAIPLNKVPVDPRIGETRPGGARIEWPERHWRRMAVRRSPRSSVSLGGGAGRQSKTGR